MFVGGQGEAINDRWMASNSPALAFASSAIGTDAGSHARPRYRWPEAEAQK